jgi:peroxiredoxin
VKQALRSLLALVCMLVVASSWAELKDLDGATHKLADFTGKGKWTVVMLWASDCRVCNAEIAQYIQFNNSHKDKDASILGISLDGQSRLDAARGFIKRHAVTFPSLIGEPEQVAELYQNLTGNEWLGTPSFLVYSPSGELLAAQAGAVPVDLIEQFIQANKPSVSK